MGGRVSSSLGLPSLKPNEISISTLTDFPSLLTQFSSNTLPVASTSKWAKPTANPGPKSNHQSLFKTLTVLDRALIGAATGGVAGAFTYLLPLDAVKTKMQTKGAAKL